MSYPYGQGFPGQPGFPQHPGNQPPVYQAPGYGQQPGYPQPGYPGGYPAMPPRGPRSAAAIFAGLLAFLGGLIYAIGGGLDIIVTAFSPGASPWNYVAGLCGLTIGSTLLIGAISLWRRKMIGRRLIVSGCVIVTATFLALLVAFFIAPDSEWLSLLIAMVPLVVFPLLTIFLTMRPSTKAWIQAKQTPAQQIPPNPNPAPPQPHWP